MNETIYKNEIERLMNQVQDRDLEILKLRAEVKELRSAKGE